VNAFGLADVDLENAALALPSARAWRSIVADRPHPLWSSARTLAAISSGRIAAAQASRYAASFAEVLEDEVSTQAEADQHDLRKAAGGVFNNKRQICCFSAVVKAR
jgi:hypothetical protein